jgi:hypothetical protein
MPTGQRGAIPTASGPPGAPRLTGGGGPAQREPEVEIVDYLRDSLNGQESGGTGVIEAKSSEAPIGHFFLIDRVVVRTNSTTPTTAKVYVGQVADNNLVDATGAGDLDIAELVQPYYVPGGQRLTVRWEGVSAGARAIANLQYRLARMVR